MAKDLSADSRSHAITSISLVVPVPEGALRYISAITATLLTHYTKIVYYRIIALMLGRLRMDVDTAIEHYDDLTKQVFSDVKAWGGDGKFKATKLEKAVKSVVEAMTGDSESPLLDNQAEVCRT